MKDILKPTSDFELEDEIILRDFLALERTRLANERTFLSYIRTSLYLFLGGLAFLQLQGFGEIGWIGYLSLALSIIMLVVGYIRFRHLKKQLAKYNQKESELSGKNS